VSQDYTAGQDASVEVTVTEDMLDANPNLADAEGTALAEGDKFTINGALQEP